MSATKVTIMGAVIWAVAFITSAVVLRGQRLGDWIEGILLVGWIIFISYRAARAGGRIERD